MSFDPAAIKKYDSHFNQSHSFFTLGGVQDIGTKKRYRWYVLVFVTNDRRLLKQPTQHTVVPVPTSTPIGLNNKAQ
jgi:hypothetical protein